MCPFHGAGSARTEEFATLIQHWEPKTADVAILDPIDWDRAGQYKAVVDAVRQAGRGNDVRVYRVARGATTAEYWVVTRLVDGDTVQLVGAKALAVES